MSIPNTVCGRSSGYPNLSFHPVTGTRLKRGRTPSDNADAAKITRSRHKSGRVRPRRRLNRSAFGRRTPRTDRRLRHASRAVRSADAVVFHGVPPKHYGTGNGWEGEHLGISDELLTRLPSQGHGRP